MLKLVPKPAELHGITELDWTRLQVLWQGGGSDTACEEYLQYCTQKQEQASREREAKARTETTPSFPKPTSLQLVVHRKPIVGSHHPAHATYLQRKEAVKHWLTAAEYEAAVYAGMTRSMTMPEFAEHCASDLRAFGWLRSRAENPAIFNSAKARLEPIATPERSMGISINDFAQAGIEWLRSQTAKNNALQQSSQTQLARSERNAQIQERQAHNAIERERNEAEIAWCNRMLDVLHSPADMSVVDDWWND